VRVAVLGGGRSSEHDVSLDSAAAVRGGLAEAGHDVLDVQLHRDGTWWHDGEELALRPGRGLLGCDVVFPVLHGPFGEDGTVQGLLELLDVAYVGSGVLASAGCMDKVVFKDLMAQAGLAQVDYAAVLAPTREDVDAEALVDVVALGLPCWVKPARLGSSVGIVKVKAAEELEAALDVAFAHDGRVIVEAGAPEGALEVECSVLGPNAAPEVSVAGEIVIQSEWYDYEAKYTPGGMELVVPARISATAAARVKELAALAFTAAGCSGLARADFFVHGESVLLNELNTMPGQTRTSVYGKLWAASGVDYPQLLTRLCEVGVDRFRQEREYRF
jgi:D-alanine-D-alanine ligase